MQCVTVQSIRFANRPLVATASSFRKRAPQSKVRVKIRPRQVASAGHRANRVEIQTLSSSSDRRNGCEEDNVSRNLLH